MSTRINDPAEHPDFEAGIFRVLHLLKRGGQAHPAMSDLMFLGGTPYVILEWGGPADNQFPLVKVRLEPALLQESARGGYYQYDGEAIDPAMAAAEDAPPARRSAVR